MTVPEGAPLETGGAQGSSFWADYRSTLKPRDVDEPIDTWFHRPIAYVVAKALERTPLTPNHVTGLSMLSAIASGVLLFMPLPTPQRHIASGLCMMLSQILDCADGQLARLRGTSSAFGRAVDGAADTVGGVCAAIGVTYMTYTLHPTPWWMGAGWIVACLLTIYTSQMHTTIYDHVKNVYLRLTLPGFHDAEDLEDVTGSPLGSSLLERMVHALNVAYLTTQRRVLVRFDPQTYHRLSEAPAFDARRAAVYVRYGRAPMRILASLFGLGGLMFGMGLFVAIGRPDLYMVYRFCVLNVVLLAVVLPLQRRASRAFRAEQTLTPRPPLP